MSDSVPDRCSKTPPLTSRTLLPANRWPGHSLTGGDGLTVRLLENGTLRGIWAQHILINRLLGTLGGNSMRLFLRRLRGAQVTDACEAVGPASNAAFSCTPQTAQWQGTWNSTAGLRANNDQTTFAVQLVLNPDQAQWAWHARVEGLPDDETWDAILVQDIALAGEGTVRNNEKYVSQYLDHRIETHREVGPVVMSRQALPQHNRSHPWLLSLATQGIAAMTDSVAFFGPQAKADGSAKHLWDTRLPHGVTQHESAAVVLQTQPTPPSDHVSCISFAFAFVADHQDASSEQDLEHAPALLDWTRNTAETFAKTTKKTTGKTSVPADSHGDAIHTAPLLSGYPATDADLESWFGPSTHWRHIERETAKQQGKDANASAVHSFFHGTDRHVATFQKDTALRRGHGHILRTGQAWMPAAHTVGMTCYQHGVFASQVTLGNTTFGQITGIARDPINLDRLAGLRLSVELEPGQGFAQLAEASAFEMAPGWCRWWYRIGERVLTVRAVATPDAPLLRFELLVVTGKPVCVRMTQHICFSEGEDNTETTVEFNAKQGTCTAKPSPQSRQADAYPESRFVLSIDQPDLLTTFDALPIDISSDSDANYPYIVAETNATEALAWTLAASPDEQGMHDDLSPSIEGCVQSADEYWAELGKPLAHLAEQSQGNASLALLAETVPWFIHNAMIHLSLPHGLEQFGGAAWGTRDVCQGPVEMLRAIDRPDVIADILRVVFSHQHRQTGNWPQWFMHPPFQAIQAGESHGDVVVWPMYALCHYLEMTGDTSILDETITYTEHDPAGGFPFSGEQHAQTIRQHVELAIERIIAQRIPGTALPRYGDGDWNDSLQPAEPWMAERMVSSWTIALLQHTLSRLSSLTAEYEPDWSETLALHAKAVAKDFQKWCVIQGQVAGIVLFSESYDTAEPLLHPKDVRTGIHHSLIPMNRGLLAGLYDDAQTRHHLQVMSEHLAAPDGMRLMERPPKYTGGTSRFFQRAESAAFFGREIGLMYTHAHLRTCETMIQRGDIKEAIDALNIVNPVGITDRIPNATPRQANAYFSSSDAGFNSRHEADAHHDKVYTGDVPANGGWRIYSSGPGIFLWLLSRCFDAQYDKS